MLVSTTGPRSCPRVGPYRSQRHRRYAGGARAHLAGNYGAYSRADQDLFQTRCSLAIGASVVLCRGLLEPLAQITTDILDRQRSHARRSRWFRNGIKMEEWVNEAIPSSMQEESPFPSISFGLH